MNIYALVPLLSVLAYAVLITLVLRHARRRERRAFGLYLTAAGVWSLISFLLHLDYTFLLEYTLPLFRILLVIFIWMAVTYYYFVRVFVYRPPGLGVYLGIGSVAVVVVLTSLGLLPEDAQTEGGILFTEYGPYFLLMSAFAFAFAMSSMVWTM